MKTFQEFLTEEVKLTKLELQSLDRISNGADKPEDINFTWFPINDINKRTIDKLKSLDYISTDVESFKKDKERWELFDKQMKSYQKGGSGYMWGLAKITTKGLDFLNKEMYN